MREELAVAVSLAREAGREVMRRFGGPMTVERKADSSPVTEADRAADTSIRAGLLARFPQDAILSEETPDDGRRFTCRRVWLVDPLDGTRHFVAGQPEFAVMIGLAERGRAILGVVHLPADDVTFAAAEGVGAHRIDPSGTIAPLRIAPFARETGPVVVVSHGPEHARSARAAVAAGAQEVVRSGSVGRKATMVAEGRADAYVTASRHSRAWDACAPDALVRLAGGVFLAGSGEPVRYDARETRNLTGLIACRPGLERRLARALRETARPAAGGRP